ncbi:hypothetical protein L7F22_039634 [Adiantum nelumboides]|nr:hypothetical protein [Adiantum nelumboides]
MSDACQFSGDGTDPSDAALASTHMTTMISNGQMQQEPAYPIRAGDENGVLAQPTIADYQQQQEAPLMNLNCPASSNETYGTAKEVEGPSKKLQYVLRTNPKRSRRFLDPDYSNLPFTSPVAPVSTTVSSSITITGETPAAICAPSPPPTAPIKKPNSIFSEKARACTECGKEFHSWKALFGHMRCHPERQWRGIQPPSSSSTFSPKFKSSPAAKRSKATHMPPPDIYNDTCAEAQCSPILDESDAESIEAAYMHERDEEINPEVEKGTQAPLQNEMVMCGPAPSPDFESEVIMDEQDMADCLVMLAFAAKGEAGDKFVGCRFDRDQRGEDVHSSLPVITAEPKKTIKKKSWQKTAHVQNAEEKAAEFDVVVGDSSKSRFQCTSCKKTFRSHQALGGHRASHKKVKGCFARTQAPEDTIAPLQAIEMTLEERNITEMQLDVTTPIGEKGQQEDVRDQKIRMSMGQFLQFSIAYHEKMDNDVTDSVTTMDKKQLKHQSSSSSSSSSVIAGAAAPIGALLAQPPKIHQCTVCNKVFSTGQALRGHKTCHWGSSPTSNSSQKGTPSQDSDDGCDENSQLSLHMSMSDRRSELSRRHSCTFTVDEAQMNGLSAVTGCAVAERPCFHHVEDTKDSQNWLVRGVTGAECHAVASGKMGTTGHVDGCADSGKEYGLQTGHDVGVGEDACHESGVRAWHQQKHESSLLRKEELILDLYRPLRRKLLSSPASSPSSPLLPTP